MEDSRQNELSNEEKQEFAKNYIDLEFQRMLFAEKRNSELHDSFSQLEVQIAAILLTFSGLFFKNFTELSINLTATILFMAKLFYISSIFFSVLSLTLGLMQIMRKEIFWDEQGIQRAAVVRKWMKFLQKKSSYEEVIAYQEGVVLGKTHVSTPKWAWVLQTISLGIAIGSIFTLFLVFIFD